jgi:hypothetical protein
MKKLLFSVGVVLLLCQSLFAKPVSKETAQIVATNFFTHVSGVQVRAITESYSATTSDRTLYFAFTINDNQGFVLVSADDRTIPILGYSTETGFHIPNNNLVGVGNWLENYSKEINYIVVNELPADQKIITAWAQNIYNQYSDGTKGASGNSATSITAVAPLLTCNWNQLPFYNDACPFDAAANDRTVTGCPATAMGQIMKKWGYPAVGVGHHSYKTDKYGTLSADFGATQYNWSAMPNEISDANTDIAQLMLHLGVAVEMQYGPASTGGSGSYVIEAASPTPAQCCEHAYKTYFRYDSTTLRGLSRANYSDMDWKTQMRTDLDLSRPLQYAGSGTGGGHTWVCDGYDANEMFHMNWGWGGVENGYFTIDALNPGQLGAGGGAGGFNSDQQCLLGIQPLKPLTVANLTKFTIAEAVQITPNPVAFGQAFTVTTRLTNNSGGVFQGDIAALAFDNQGRFVQEVDALLNQTVGKDATTGVLTFSTAGLATVAGTYTIGIYAAVGTEDWTLVSDGNFKATSTVVINEPVGTLQLATNIAISPAVWIANQPASVSVNFKNIAPTIFRGAISADLFDLDGYFVENIAVHNEPTGLAPGALYPSAITFSLDTIRVAPGTYFLALEYGSDLGDTALCGGTLHSNPIYVDIVESLLPPDIYEPNNTEDAAFNVQPAFSGDEMLVGTTNANINVGTDNDYYKLTLPPGYKYTVLALLHDEKTDRALLTVDANVSFKANGTWSPVYDDTVKTPIVMNNGGTLIAHVSTANAGGTGTYALVVDVIRSALGVESIAKPSAIAVYPNPASAFVFINAMDKSFDLQSVEISNLLGQTVRAFTRKELESNGMKMNVVGLEEGVYFMTMHSSTKIATQKLIIAR